MGKRKWSSLAPSRSAIGTFSGSLLISEPANWRYRHEESVVAPASIRSRSATPRSAIACRRITLRLCFARRL